VFKNDEWQLPDCECAFHYWDGALPYLYVCAVTGVSPEVLQDVILNQPRLKRDLDELRHSFCGTLL